MFAWGGGTGSTHYYPGAATYSTPVTTVATDPNYFLWGDGNTCTYGGYYRWGGWRKSRMLDMTPSADAPDTGLGQPMMDESEAITDEESFEIRRDSRSAPNRPKSEAPAE